MNLLPVGKVCRVELCGISWIQYFLLSDYIYANKIFAVCISFWFSYFMYFVVVLIDNFVIFIKDVPPGGKSVWTDEQPHNYTTNLPELYNIIRDWRKMFEEYEEKDEMSRYKAQTNI